MTTNVSKLKKTKTKGKGEPPPPDDVPDVIIVNDREEPVVLKPLQVRIPQTVFEEFSEQAAKENGYKHGAKKKLFMKIWAEYKARNI